MKDICVKCGTKFEWMLDDAIIRYGCGNPKQLYRALIVRN